MAWLEFIVRHGAEIIATLAAVVSVVLIARQNILGWPLGILWAVISAWLAFRWNLVSDGVLYVTYVPIQLYSWFAWHRRKDEADTLGPAWLARSAQLNLVIAIVVAVVLWGLGVKFFAEKIPWIATPVMLWRDATSTVLNYFAQCLQARKRMENWVLWLVVNLLGIYIYGSVGSTIYAAQYAFFLVLGVYGWWSWQRALKGGVK